MTYSQGKDSLDWALRDARRLIETGKAKTVLVGYHDEATPLFQEFPLPIPLITCLHFMRFGRVMLRTDAAAIGWSVPGQVANTCIAVSIAKPALIPTTTISMAHCSTADRLSAMPSDSIPGVCL